MLPKIKSVALIPRTDKGYLEHCKKMRESKKINSAESIPDRKATISAWMESSFNQIMGMHYTKVETDIITWLELNRYGSYSRRFKEIDGFFKFENRYILLEVKSSISKSSFTKGKSQVNSNQELLSNIYPNVAAILVLADCRCFDSEFGYAIEMVTETTQNGSSYQLVGGLKPPEITNESNKFLWLINESEVTRIADIYGPPYEIDPSNDF